MDMVKVIMKAQTHREVFCNCETLKEATEICNLYDWEFEDGNEFVWSLEIDED
jgi:hypothetical protein